MLEATIGLRVGDLDLDISLSVADDEVVALLGPNGAGKSTTVRAVAGLLGIERGRIAVDDVVLDEPAAGTFVPTEDRPVGVVFQDHLLFPRMSVLDNVAFGLRARGLDRRQARDSALELLGRFDLGDRAADRPGTLSGGQSQRVALARALATEPAVLLLDEPLASLDATTRIHVRAELRRHLTGFRGARLLVTHDPVDALVLADRLVIIEDGAVVQEGRPADVTARPASRYVADLVGLNLLEGRREGDRAVHLVSGGSLAVADPVPGDEVAIAIRPQAVTLHRHEPEGSARNAWAATVADLEAAGDRIRVRLDGPVPVVAEVTAASSLDLDLTPGTPVWASVKAVDLTVYER